MPKEKAGTTENKIKANMNVFNKVFMVIFLEQALRIRKYKNRKIF